MITGFIIFLSLFVPFFTCTIKKSAVSKLKGADFFQPGIIVALFYYVYVVLPAANIWLHDYNSYFFHIDNSWQVNSALLVCIVGMLFFGAGYNTRIILFSKINNRVIRRSVGGKSFVIAFVALLLSVGLFFKLFYLLKVGGLTSDLLLNLSPSARRSAGIRLSGVEVLGGSLFLSGVLLFVLHTFSRKASITIRALVPLVMLLVFTALVEYVLSGAKRSAIVPVLVFPLIWYHYLVSPIDFKKGVILAICGFLLMASFLMVRIVVPLYIKGDEVSMSAAENIKKEAGEFYLNSGELMTFEMIMLAIRDRDDIVDNAGGSFLATLKYNFGPLRYMIPRFIWPTKPENVEGISHLFAKITHGSNAQHGVAVTIFGTLFVYAHILGVGLGMYIIGLLFRAGYEWLEPWSGDVYRVYLYGIGFWMMFQFLRFGDIGFTSIYFVQSLFVPVFLIVVIYLMNRMVRLGDIYAAK